MFKLLARCLALFSVRQKLVFLSLSFTRSALSILDLTAVAAVGLIVSIGIGDGDSRILRMASDLVPGLSIETATEPLFFLVISAFVVKSVFSLLFLVAIANYLAKIEALTAARIADQSIMKTLEQFKKLSPSKLQFALLQSNQTAVSTIPFAFAVLIGETTTVISLAVVAVVMEPITSLVAIAYFTIVFLLINIFISDRSRVLGRRTADLFTNISQTLRDIEATFRELSALGRRDFFMKDLRQSREEYAFLLAQNRVLVTLPRVVAEVSLFVGLGILAFIFAFRGDIENSIPGLALLLVAGLRIMSAALPLQSAVTLIRTVGPQAERAIDVIESVEVPETFANRPGPESYGVGQIETRRLNTDISLSNVTFAHDDAGSPALVEIDLHVQEGEFVAICGPSGSGKSTLADLILGVQEPVTGEVRIGGLTPAQWQTRNPGDLGYVPQRPGMLVGSILENIAIGRGRSDIDVIWVQELLAKVGLQHMFLEEDRLHRNLESQLGALSGGQLQRIGIARALYSSPRIIVFDEVTSALDPESAQVISNLLLELKSRHTLVVVAHKMSTVKMSDRVAFIEGGRMAGFDSYKSLASRVPRFASFLSLSEPG